VTYQGDDDSEVSVLKSLEYFYSLHFLLFHSRNYYKLSLCVIFSNTFDNLWRF